MVKCNPYNLHGEDFKSYIELEKKKIELSPANMICKEGVCYPRKYVSVDTHLENLMKGDVISSYDGDMEIEIASEAIQVGGEYRYQALAPMHYITDEIECQSLWNIKSKVPRPKLIKAGDTVELKAKKNSDLMSILTVGDTLGVNKVAYIEVVKIQFDDIYGKALVDFEEGDHKWELIRPPVYDIKWVQAGDFQLLEKYDII